MVTPETPDTSAGTDDQLVSSTQHLNSTYTCTPDTFPTHRQSNMSDKVRVTVDCHRIDDKWHKSPSAANNTVSSPSDITEDNSEPHEMDELTVQNQEFEDGDAGDQCQNSAGDLHAINKETSAPSPTEVQARELQRGKKRKLEGTEKPTIISDVMLGASSSKRLRKTDLVTKVSPDSQKGRNQGRSRKIIESGPKYADYSDSEASSPEEPSADDLESRVQPKRRVVFDFAESDNDDPRDDEYQPSEGETSESGGEDDSRTDDEELEEDLRTEKKFSDSLNTTIGDNPQSSAPDDRELTVGTTGSGTKKHFCIYCKKLQRKFARHLQLKHSQEPEVAKFIALPPRNKERGEIIAAIRKEGDHVHNGDRQFNSGQLIVCRLPSKNKQKTAEDYIACGNCKGQYSRSVVRHHWRRCTKRSGKHERIILVKGKKIAGRVHERANADVRKHVFPYLREDEVVRSIRYDELVILFANKQCEKYGTHQHLYQMIRARLRLIGRFLVAIKQINNRIETCMDVFQPRNYDSVLDAVRKVAIFLPETKTFQHPAVGSTLGTLIKQLAEVLRTEYIKREDRDKQLQVDSFLNLLSEDYGTSINRVVTETQTQQHRRKVVTLPTTEDIKTLYDYIVSERAKYLSQVNTKFSLDAWKKLGEATLLSLLIFNRRRPGEIERLYIEDYRCYRGIDDMADKETYNSLSAEGKALAKRYVRFVIRGKRNRDVPVLIDCDTLECMKVILRHRNAAGVSEKNLYLFGLPSCDKDRHKYLRACDLMRQYSENCGANVPHLLRGTQLRKHIATRCINLNLEGGQITDLANFMGHHQDIHKRIYRQPVAATDIVKISKILNIVQDIGQSNDSSDDEEGTPSTSAQFQANESNVSMDDTAREPDNSVAGSSTQYSQSSRRSECSTPKRSWNDDERAVVLSAFGRQLENGKIPTGQEMENLIASNDCLKGRTVPQMRTWLHTYKKKLTK